MPLQYFALDSTHGGFAAAMTALATLNAANFSYAPTLVQRAASHDGDIKIVAAIVEEADLTGDLEDLHDDNYPNALCQHRWRTRANFRLSGFHVLGESVRSYEGVAGRPARFIRPQQSRVRTAANYGAGDGTTHYDALNGPQDPAIDGGATTNFQTGTSYFIAGRGPHGDTHTRWGDLGNGGNPGTGNGLAGQGYLPVEDASGLGAAGKINIYSDPDFPGMFMGTYTHWEAVAPGLAWEEYDPTNHIYVHGGFQTAANGGRIGQTSAVWEADCDDITVDAETIVKRHVLKGHATFSDLDGDTGRGRYYAQAGNPAAVSWTKVILFDGVSTYTDVTATANDATANNTELIPIGAADGACVYFVFAGPFSQVSLDISQKRVGGTFVWEYGRAGDYAQFTGLYDPTAALSAGSLFGETFSFNPKADWAQTTVAAGEAFETTGYVVRLRKTAGTVATAARIDRTQCLQGAVFVHRWNDTAPTRGLCAGEGASGFGYRFALNGKGNVEFIRHRAIGAAQHSDWSSATDITLSGCQLGLTGAMIFGSGTPNWTFRAGTVGTRFWAVTDHLHQDKTDPFIQDILAEIQQAIDDGVNLEDDGWEPNIAAFDDLPEWSDFVLVGNGPYLTAGSWSFAFDGMKVRRSGQKMDGYNDADLIDVTTSDKHALASLNGVDGASWPVDRFAVERGTAMINFHAQADGNNDAPVSGSSGATKNMRFTHGYCSTFGGQHDNEQLTCGINLEANPDIGRYDNGTGGNENNLIAGWGFKDIKEPAQPTTGTAISAVADGALKARYCVVDNPGRAWLTHGGFSNNGPRSTNAITATDATPGATFNDVTNNLKDSGNVVTPLFPTGAAGECFYVGAVRYTQRTIGISITTAGVGSPTLAFEYNNGSGWVAVDGLSDGTGGLTAGGLITFNRPADNVAVTIGSKTILAFRIRIASGSFSVVPEAVEANTETHAASIDIQRCRFKNVDVSAGCRVGMLFHGVGTIFTNTGYVIDANNIIELMPGQSASTAFWAGNAAGPWTLAQWQALAKPALTTDAEVDSVFGPNNQLVA